MNLARVLQPYVCCLGNPVAGNPTQFVMYRAARACGVDWRFFTSQVEIDQFEVACRGVQALGLSGMALFDPFQSKALSLLDSVTESAMKLGRVNVARLDGNSWLGDNTLGLGIMNCVGPMLKTASQANPSLRSEAEDDRASSILVIGDRKIASAMRLANPEMARRIVVTPDGADANAGLTESLERETSNSKSDWELESLEEFADRGLDIGCLVLCGAPNANTGRQLSALSWAKSSCCLFLGNTSDKQLRQWSELVKSHDVIQIEAVELMAHQAAADFFFWTGVWPETDLIRDSLEEYLQW